LRIAELEEELDDDTVTVGSVLNPSVITGSEEDGNKSENIPVNLIATTTSSGELVSLKHWPPCILMRFTPRGTNRYPLLSPVRLSAYQKDADELIDKGLAREV
jgi:hypothetical protein